jgi:hypothetical protein
MEVKTYLKTLAFLHLSLVAGLIILMLFAISTVNAFNTAVNEGDALLYLVPIIALLGYFGSQFLFKKQTLKIKSSEHLHEKLKKFQSASHIKYFLIEAPAFLALFAYYKSGNALPLVIAICLLLYLIAQRPSKENVKRILPLTADEIKEFN